MREATGKVVLYKAVDGSIAMDVRLQGETVWLTQKQMSELFVTERSVITKHLRNIFQSKELDEKSVSAKFAHTAEDGKTYLTKTLPERMPFPVRIKTDSQIAIRKTSTSS